MLPSLVEPNLDLPVVLPGRPERQAFWIPVVKVTDQMDALRSDRTRDLEVDDDFVLVCRAPLMNQIHFLIATSITALTSPSIVDLC